jgi:hypothetical protein
MVIAASIVTASSATASTPGVTANCGGWTVVSANYVRLTSSNVIVGSIQLCKKLAYTGDAEYFARIEMYSPLSAGRMADAYMYFTSAQGGRQFETCYETATGQVHAGETTCYSHHEIDVQSVWNFQAVGRYYRAEGSNWVLIGEGYTATIF